MDILKKIFPGAFGVKDVVSMIIRIVIYVVVGAIAGVLNSEGAGEYFLKYIHDNTLSLI